MKKNKLRKERKIIVWKLILSDTTNPCYYSSLKEVAESLEDMAEGIELGDRITITQEEMLKSDFDKLPDWQP